jgi:uncharacterized protein YdhG (YjbR/CyaY superfamily)
MSPAAKDVDAYLAALPDEQRIALQDVRRTIKAAAPEAIEAISYGIPGYKVKGKPLIHFGAAKNHCAIYGAAVAESDKEDLKGYDTSKGTVRFSPNRPLPPALVEKLVKTRIAEIEAGGAGYGKQGEKEERNARK